MENLRVLLAEDNLRLGTLVAYMLEQEKVDVQWVVDGETAYERALSEEYDLLILDWMMPKKSGLAICQSLRKQGYQKAILMLTAKDAVEDRVMGLDAGADDYLVKPFEFDELMARVRALFRRNWRQIPPNILQIGSFVMDRNQKLLTRDGEEIQLSPREFQIFDLLIQNKGCTVPRDMIMDRVWGWDSEVSSNSLDSYVKILRKKLGMKKDGMMIYTTRGTGYRLEE